MSSLQSRAAQRLGRGACGKSCRCPGCAAPRLQAPKVARRAVVVTRAGYGNGNGNGVSVATVPSQLRGAVRPLPADGHSLLPSKTGLNDRYAAVLQHFPSSLGVDDFIARVEVALCYFGFTGDNTIAVTNLCRDEITAVLKDKIEAVWGGSFNVNGLGGVITCGVTGIGAGLSHAPQCATTGRERYIFFSFPHIAIDEAGEVGTICRPGRAGKSHACGALIKCLGEVKEEGLNRSCRLPGVHDDDDPEYSILKARLLTRLKTEGLEPNEHFSLSDITKVAERAITADLEKLIGKAVDPRKADYAVVTGVQIHNWARDLSTPGATNLEFVAPSTCYAVVNGIATHLDLRQIPQVTPRMLNLLAAASTGMPAHSLDAAASVTTGSSSTLQEVPSEYLFKRLISRPRTSFMNAGNGYTANSNGHH